MKEITLEDLGYNASLEQHRKDQNLESFNVGRIISEHRDRYIVKSITGEFDSELIGNLRFTAESKLDLPAVGDWVAISEYDEGKALIHSIYPRHSILERQAVGKSGERQIIATNIDYGIIVQAVNRDFNINRLERYLTICNASKVKPIIILSKIDLIDELELKTQMNQIAERIKDVPVIAISNQSHIGLDSLTNTDGIEIKLDSPFGDELPEKGFELDLNGYLAPIEDGSSVEVIVKSDSKRLQLLERFAPWDGKDYTDMPVLIKAKGKCTTDHISMAGPWLRFRGHLDNLSDNLLIGAVNAYNDETNNVKNQLTGEYCAVPEAARAYKASGINWVVVGDENYGEGSSREHAAMEPRFLGGKAIIVKGFARIHETNLKKQGMLPLTFANPSDYDLILEDDKINLVGLNELAPAKQVNAVIMHNDSSSIEIKLNHSMNQSQIEWFKAGSALNLIALKNQ
jgi:3-isopropylmalate dehydratase small subunit/acylphosphatase